MQGAAKLEREYLKMQQNHLKSKINKLEDRIGRLYLVRGVVGH